MSEANIADVMEVPQALIAELGRGFYFKALEGQKKVALAQAFAHRNGGAKNMSFGRQTLRISPESYHYWGQRLGYACWRDKQFRAQYARDNPECRVEAKAAANRVVVPRTIAPGVVAATDVAPRKIKFSRKYDF